MTKKIFKSIMFVCALVLTVGLAAVMGILYSNFDGQMRKELSKEAAYLAYGVAVSYTHLTLPTIRLV